MIERFLLVHIPTVWLGVGIVAFGVGTALVGLALVRRSIEVGRLRPQHDVAGFIIAVVGVIYAVLLAFMVVVQWEAYASARSNAASEATSLGNLYRDAASFGAPGRPLANAVFAYSSAVVEREYPYVAKHQAEDPTIDPYLNAMWRAVTKLPTATPTQQAFVQQAITDVSSATED